jgi:hypothetical protein
MAEINIQRKERSVWPWLLAGVLLLGLLWFLFARNSPDGFTATGADSARWRDTSAAAGTLGSPRDSVWRDTVPVPR